MRDFHFWSKWSSREHTHHPPWNRQDPSISTFSALLSENQLRTWGQGWDQSLAWLWGQMPHLIWHRRHFACLKRRILYTWDEVPGAEVKALNWLCGALLLICLLFNVVLVWILPVIKSYVHNSLPASSEASPTFIHLHSAAIIGTPQCGCCLEPSCGWGHLPHTLSCWSSLSCLPGALTTWPFLESVLLFFLALHVVLWSQPFMSKLCLSPPAASTLSIEKF